MTGRFLNVAGEAVQIGGGGDESPVTVTLVSEAHLNQSGLHSYSSISGLQAGDMMILFTGGPYRMTAVSGWATLGDAGPGNTALAVSAFAKVATSSSESVAAGFSSSSADNFSSLVVLRGPVRAWRFSIQTYGSANNTTALTFPSNDAFGVATSGFAGQADEYPSVSEALMFVLGANAGITFTPSPAATSTVFSLATNGTRTAHLFRVPSSASYSATPSATSFKGGVVVHLG
jgi:hypothetical protein